MQCVQCGRPLQPDDVACPLCGHPTDQGADEQPTSESVASARPGALQIGDPEDPFANTVFGGTALRDERSRMSPEMSHTPAATASDDRASTTAGWPAHTPLVLWPTPRPIARRSLKWLPLVAVCCATCVVAALVAGALTSSGQWLTILNAGAQTSPATLSSRVATPTTQANGLCPLTPIDSHASQALRDVQLTTGIAGPQTDAPIDHVTSFRVGQTIYVTFALATNVAGSLTGTICTNGIRAARTLAIQAGQLYRRGEFNLPASLTSAQAGPGAAVLTWNGAVAASLSFTVSTR